MAEKPSITLPGTVEKIIKPSDPGQPEKAQIGIEGADEMFCEIRIENSLTTENGKQVRLKKGAKVDVTVEVDREAVNRKNK
jgi:hypothetical protein